MTEVANKINAVFAYNLHTTGYDEQFLEAIVTLAMSDVPFTCNGVSAMICLQ